MYVENTNKFTRYYWFVYKTIVLLLQYSSFSNYWAGNVESAGLLQQQWPCKLRCSRSLLTADCSIITFFKLGTACEGSGERCCSTNSCRSTHVALVCRRGEK